jgi:hypothetical protein
MYLQLSDYLGQAGEMVRDTDAKLSAKFSLCKSLNTATSELG